MLNKFLKISIAISLLLLIYSCSNTRYLNSNEILFNGSKLTINKEKEINITPDFRYQLKDVLYPEKNKEFLGLKISLWIYNHVKEPKKEKGFKYFLKYKLGEKPVVYNSETSKKVVQLLNNRMENNGFFNCKITEKTTINKKRSFTNYNIFLKQPKLIDTVIFDINDKNIALLITKNIDQTFLLPEDVYTLETIKNERARIVKDIRNNGYYYFRNDFLVYHADTNGLDGKIKFNVKFKQNLDNYKKEKYVFSDINIIVKNNLKDSTKEQNTVLIDSIRYTDKNNFFKPKKMTQNVFFKNNVLYSDSLYRKTMNYFYGYDIINSLNINFSLNDTTTKTISSKIQLSKSKTNSFEIKLSGETKSNGFSGPSADITFANHNIFHGGEKLSFSLESGLEKQIGEETNLDYILRFALKGELKLPNITPGLKNLSNKSIRLPYSIIEGGITYLKYYPTMDIWETNTSYAYRWFPTNNNSWELKPVSFIYQKVFMKELLESGDYQDLPYIPFGLENQFSLGSSITFITTNKYISKTRNSYFFKSSFEIAGNLMYWIFSSFANKQEEPYKVFNQPFSQFSRLDLDFRYYRKIQKNNIIATRLLSYLSIPYENSVDLPFFRKYFAGGPNSLRGFQTGGIGPGTYYVPDAKPDIRINNGDIRLEANIEYRFKLVGRLFSVLFVDAGNVWLVREDTLRPGGEFKFNKILQSSSVSIGTGLRYDFSVIAIRLDFGAPLKYPYNKSPGDVYGEYNLFDPDKLGKNMIVHFAIDYPF